MTANAKESNTDTQKFSKGERIMLTIYEGYSRRDTIDILNQMIEDLYYDQEDLKEMAEQLIEKLESMSDLEYYNAIADALLML